MVPSPIHVAFYVAASDGAAATWEDRAVTNSIVLPWEELCGELSKHELTACGSSCIGHDCKYKIASEAWSPVELTGRRSNANVRAVTLAVFDLDDVPNNAMLEIAERIDGFEYLCVSSHSHRPPHANRLRLIMPMTRPASPTEWPIVLRMAISVLQLPADPVCKDLARLYFLPTAPVGTQPLAERGHGVLLNVDMLLQIAAETNLATAATLQPALEHDQAFNYLSASSATDLAEMRKRLAQVRTRKARSTTEFDKELYFILDQVLHGKPFAVPGSQPGPTDMIRGRDNAINKAASLLAFALPPHTPTGAAIELLRASISSMQFDPEGLQHWLGRAAFSYDRAMVRRLERDAKSDVANSNLRARLAALARPQSSAVPPSAPAAAGGPSPIILPPSGIVVPPNAGLIVPDGASVTGTGHWGDLILKRNGKPISCGENAFHILSHAEETAGHFYWDDMAKTFRITGGIFASTALEMLDVEVTDWLQRQWDLTVDVGIVGKRIERLARLRTIDPLQQWLRSLKWDGRPGRVANFLLDNCNAVRNNSAGKDITEHLRRISHCFLVSTVARALTPGCQVDTVLILEGPEGYGKTSMFRELADPWFCGNGITLGDKDSLMLAAKNWILELPELAGMRKADVFSMNAFITNKRDQFRLPYGRVISECARRCVIVGTVNPELSGGGYFQNTGGIRRRYWPVVVGAPINIDRIKAEREQIFAEAVYLLLNGASWWLNAVSAAQAEANEQVEERLIESRVTQTLIADWWFKKPPAQRPAEVTTLQIAKEVLQVTQEVLNDDRKKRSIETDIGLSLNAFIDSNGTNSFRKYRRTRNGVPTWVYIPTDEMREAQHSTLRTIPSGPPTAGGPFGKKKP